MLAVPTSSEARFLRTLYDVDRTKPSPFGWQRCSKRSRRYVRRMGLVESFFNTMATLHEGRTDIFYRIPLSCPAGVYEQVKRRLPLVWALLCRRHPMLSAYVETRTPDGQSLDPEEAASRRNAGEGSQDGSSSFEPHFVFDLPATGSDLLERASHRIVCFPESWKDGMQGHSNGPYVGTEMSRDDAVVAWLDRYVWNGKRRFLKQHDPFGLARLILLPPLPPQSQQESVSFDLIVCTAHCISDGLSISSVAGELLQLLASCQLPEELPELVSEAETSVHVPGATMGGYSAINDDVKQVLLDGLLDPAPPSCTGPFDDSLKDSHFAPLLPPSIEATYPELLPSATAVDSPARLARLRWFWTIRRVICQIRAANAEKATLSDFKANRLDKDVNEPWWGAQTNWSIVRLSPKDTSALTQLAKRRGIRVGSLLYAVAACALNTLENEYTQSSTRAEQPTTTVMGFPFSVRRFLDARAYVDPLLSADTDSLLPPSSLGVKLGFNGVSLPPASLFSLPEMPSSSGTQLNAFQVAQLWQIARQVQKQFNSIFQEPRFMHADGFLMGLERETRFRKSGVKDVFQVLKDDIAGREEAQEVAGEDERKPGLTKKNMQGPGSSLNFSMVGLLDPVLPSRLDLPFKGSQAFKTQLEVREGLMFGVRTRAGEAFGTSFTFRGQLNLELGHDAVVWDTTKVEQYLALMKHIVEAMVAFEQARH